MVTADFSKKNAGEIRRNYFRNELIAYDPNYATQVEYLYGNTAENKYYELLDSGAITLGTTLVDLVSASTSGADTTTRINYATSPDGAYGWFTSSGYGSVYDPTKERVPGSGRGSRKYTKNTTGRYGPFGRGAGIQTVSSSSDRATNEATLEAMTKCAPGESWGVGMYMNSVNAQLDGNVSIRWVDINGATISSSVGTKSALPANTWQWFSHVAVAPAGAYAFWIENVLDMRVDGNGVNGNVSWCTDVLIEKRLTAPVASDFFDGNTPVSGNLVHEWTAGSKVSTSRQYDASDLPKRDIWGNFDINKPTTDFNAVNKKYVDSKTGIIANVKTFGAVGDGIRNDTAPAQAAIDFLRVVGGGTLYYPPGYYYQPDAVMICGNLVVTGKGATLMKKTNADSAYSFFVGSSGSTKGYGAGQNNITCHGMIFKGSYAAAPFRRNANAFALHHTDGFLAYDNVFTEMSGAGHRFDLQGSRFITIRDNVFKGYNADYGDYRSEDIQLDFSSAQGSSFLEADLNCYDGLPTQHVTVENNKWLPLTIGGTTYPAGNPVGSHSSVANMYHQYIKIKGNYVGNQLVEDTTTASYFGLFHFVAPKDLLFEGNVIENNGKITEGLRIWRAVSGLTVGTFGGANDVSNPSATSASYTDPAVPTGSMVSSGITAQYNTFRGFNYSASRQIIYMQGSQTAYNPLYNINVDNNVFEDCKYLNNFTANDGAIPIIISDAEQVSVSHNKATSTRCLMKMTRVIGLTIHKNNTRKTAGNTIQVEACRKLDISHNTLSECGNGYDIYLADGSSNGTIGFNIVDTSSPIGPTIRVTGDGTLGTTVTRITVIGNKLTSTVGGTDRGIEYTGTATGNITALNTILGYDAPINYGVGSTSTETANMTA